MPPQIPQNNPSSNTPPRDPADNGPLADTALGDVQRSLTKIADDLEASANRYHAAAKQARDAANALRAVNLQELVMSKANDIFQQVLAKAKADAEALAGVQDNTVDQSTLDEAQQFLGQTPAGGTSGVNVNPEPLGGTT